MFEWKILCCVRHKDGLLSPPEEKGPSIHLPNEGERLLPSWYSNIGGVLGEKSKLTTVRNRYILRFPLEFVLGWYISVNWLHLPAHYWALLIL